MTDYRVQLDIYNGPLDLLLYLIRKDELDIHDIPIATITSQYLAYVELIQQLDLELAAEFLVMAATLMEIKSAMLIPRDPTDEDQADDLADPRVALVRQLLEYKQYKDTAGRMKAMAESQSQRFPRSTADLQRLREQWQAEQELDLDTLQIWDVFEAFQKLMAATLSGPRDHQVIQDNTPIDVYEIDILDQVQKQGPLHFDRIFRQRSSRTEMVGLFLALLELIRMKLVRIEQEGSFQPIYVFAQTDEPAEQAVSRALAGQEDLTVPPPSSQNTSEPPATTTTPPQTDHSDAHSDTDATESQRSETEAPSSDHNDEQNSDPLQDETSSPNTGTDDTLPPTTNQ